MKKYYKLVISIVLLIFIVISFTLARNTVNQHKAEISTAQFYTDDGLGSAAANDYSSKQASKYERVETLTYLLDAALAVFVLILVVSFIKDSFKPEDPFSDEIDSTDDLRSSYGK